MKLIFREGANGKEKIYTLISLVIVLLLMGSTSAGRYQFYDDPGYGGVVVWILAAIWVLPVLLDRHPSNKISRSNIVVRGVYWALLYFMYYGLTWGVIHYAIPSYYTITFGEETSIERGIAGKEVRTGRLWHVCYSIDYGQTYSTCVNKRFFDTVEAGDTVRLGVQGSRFGYIVRTVYKVPDEEVSTRSADS
ncbi:hypothetical protein [Microbulbifer variabilis]|uniref:hypothetical protein n=1 Tax=Microbulbifer variabilis TaxID=266805 RepID=UPI001CFD9101|nr:hypothetical protein [Microbulbifer variabilis]